jgi:hypothetical protein
MNERENPEICRCPCHAPGRVAIHFVACCRLCPFCQQRIKTYRFDEHAKDCQFPRPR